ncbi:MAG: hypothetical protein K0Q64_2417, partial [Nitrobacter vulgaris]|nr:hypothetical protein [Nitrobacter vulgaris]
DGLLQATAAAARPGAKTDGPTILPDDLFWVEASKVEALFGSGRRDEAETLKTEIIDKERKRLIAAGEDPNAVEWKADTLNEQLKKLGALLAA